MPASQLSGLTYPRGNLRIALCGTVKLRERLLVKIKPGIGKRLRQKNAALRERGAPPFACWLSMPSAAICSGVSMAGLPLYFQRCGT